MGNRQDSIGEPDIALDKLYPPLDVLVARTIYERTHGLGLCVACLDFNWHKENFWFDTFYDINIPYYS